MTMSRWMGWIAAGLLWALSGCGEHKPVLPPVVQINQEIKKKYEVAVDVGVLPVRKVSGKAFFSIINNQECVKPDYSYAIGGVKNSFTKSVDLTFRKTEQDQFVAILILDPFKDSDYFGRGKCHWEFTGLTITLAQGIPIQNITLWQKDLSRDDSPRMHIEYCATAIQYSHPPPVNYCEIIIDRLTQEKRQYFYKVIVSNRRMPT